MKSELANPDADIATFAIVPPLRCTLPLGSGERVWCGEPAHWMSPGDNPFRQLFFCEAHQHPSDVPIAGALVIRRIQIVAEVLFHAVAIIPTTAHDEALARLSAAVEQAGGLLTLRSVTSTMGRGNVYILPGRIPGR